jgi:hypothetical protein
MYCHDKEIVDERIRRDKEKNYDLVLKFYHNFDTWFEDGRGNEIADPPFMPLNLKDLNLEDVIDLIKKNGYTNNGDDWGIFDDLHIEGFWKIKE